MGEGGRLCPIKFQHHFPLLLRFISKKNLKIKYQDITLTLLQRPSDYTLQDRDKVLIIVCTRIL
jgi:hypothetical protein